MINDDNNLRSAKQFNERLAKVISGHKNCYQTPKYLSLKDLLKKQDVIIILSRLMREDR
jgi:hypothetical protein